MVPLSFAQRRLWFLYKFTGPSATYNIAAVLRLHGRLSVDALRAALRDVVLRHDSLRTLIVDDGSEPAQRVLPPERTTLEVPLVDVPPEGVEGKVAEAIEYAFDLYAEIPVRAQLLRVAPEEHVLILLVHEGLGSVSMWQMMHPSTTIIGSNFAQRRNHIRVMVR